MGRVPLAAVGMLLLVGDMVLFAAVDMVEAVVEDMPHYFHFVEDMAQVLLSDQLKIINHKNKLVLNTDVKHTS